MKTGRWSKCINVKYSITDMRIVFYFYWENSLERDNDFEKVDQF